MSNDIIYIDLGSAWFLFCLGVYLGAKLVDGWHRKKLMKIFKDRW